MLELKEGYKEALNKTKTRLQSFEKKPIISNNQGQSSPSEIDYHLDNFDFDEKIYNMR